MKTKNISQEVVEFMERTGISGSALASEACVSSAVVSRLKTGVRADARASSADKLREAMKRLEEVRRAG